MSRRQFMQASLALPIALPAVSYAVLFITSALGLSLPPVVNGILLTPLFPLAVGGIPYVVCGGLALHYLGGKSEKTHHVAAVLAPFVFAVVMFFVWGGMGVWTFGTLRDAIRLGGYYGAMSLAYGSAYVLLAYMLLCIAARIGLVERRGPS